MVVSETNCHPFQIGPYLWMHNGSIQNFARIKRRLCSALSDRLYNAIEGTTDSEHAFGLFLELLGDTSGKTRPDLATTLERTIRHIQEWVEETGPETSSMYNFAVSDGKCMAAVRYVSDPTAEPISLYFSRPDADFDDSRDDAAFRSAGVVVASERLTTNRRDWVRVAPNHILTVDQNRKTHVQLMA